MSDVIPMTTVTDELVERVARAIHRSHFAPSETSLRMEELWFETRTQMLRRARAAICAVMERPKSCGCTYRCFAPVVMGRQTPCLDPIKANGFRQIAMNRDRDPRDVDNDVHNPEIS
jgi:hypothetical protein